MPERDEPWPTGTPAWVSAAVVDLDRSMAFYTGAFGWEFDRSGPDDGHPLIARKNGRAVAGLGLRASEGPGDRPGDESAWLTHLATDDAATTADRAVAAGGVVVAPALPVGELGVSAVLQDSSGALVGLWQPRGLIGAELVNEPGAVVWNEGLVTDVEAGTAFYRELFGVSFTPLEGMAYATMDLEGRPVGGLGALADLHDPTLRPHWRTYFHSADVDADLARAAELGGRPLGDVHDSDFGRMGGVAGPDGELFWLIKPPDWS